MSIRFNQSCPTCGRRIDIRASLLGCTVACQHCGSEFTACMSDTAQPRESSDELLDRVEAALQRAESAAQKSGLTSPSIVSQSGQN
ncbi:response regulator [Rhodopirellula bahusiensis]|uniref:Response regulator n=1 Tax=Rhodopirellula bahusiensis TaxID=2014065 RepID=A0A2G1WAI8_9BACT|nr:response regulator [Rhodopirellula bahusiensis]